MCSPPHTSTTSALADRQTSHRIVWYKAVIRQVYHLCPQHRTPYTTDMSTTCGLQQMHRQSKKCLARSQAKADPHMRMKQTRYAPEYDHRVHETPSLPVVSYALISKPPLTTSLRFVVDTLANNEYNTLHDQTFKPYRILKVQANTVIIDKYVIPNTVSAGHITHVSSLQTKPSPNNTMHKARSTANKETHEVKQAQQAHQKAANSTEEYVAEKIICHIWQNHLIEYVVPWYGNGPTEGTTELADRIPSQLI